MNRQRFISLKEIINRVHKDGGDITNDITEDDVITDTIELLGVVGIPQLFEEKVAELKLEKYRAELPCDFLEERGVRWCNTAMNASTDLYNVEESRTSTPTYKIQGDYIITSIEGGPLTLSYTAVKTDEDGYPMIPDDQTFVRALVSYIIYKKVYANYINGRLPNAEIMERVERNYEFNIAQASNRLSMPSMDEFENVARMMNTFIFRLNSRKQGFKNLGDEHIIVEKKSDIPSFDFINPLDR